MRGERAAQGGPRFEVRAEVAVEAQVVLEKQEEGGIGGEGAPQEGDHPGADPRDRLGLGALVFIQREVFTPIRVRPRLEGGRGDRLAPGAGEHGGRGSSSSRGGG